MGWECSAYGGEGTCIQGFGWGNLMERDPLGRPRRRWEDNIKMDVQEVGCGGMGWINRAQDRVRWRTVFECGDESSGSIKCGEFLD